MNTDSFALIRPLLNAERAQLPRCGRGSLVPTALDRLEADRLIETGEADEAVDNGGQGRDLAELHPEDRGDQIEARDGDQSPIQGSDYNQDCCEYVEFLRKVFSSKART
jgi:hypothetical protein